MSEPAPERTPPDGATEGEERDRIAKERLADIRARCICDRAVPALSFVPLPDCPIHGGGNWPAPDDTSAPVSAEGLRERIAETLLDPLKCCVVTPFPLTPIHGTCKDCWAKALAAADDVLAALAGVPGDLPARMTEALYLAFESMTGPKTTTGNLLTWRQLAEVAMSVRWEDNARTKAENERLRAELAEASDEKLAAIKRISQLHAVTEGQLDLMTQMRDSEKARADSLVAERDALKAARTAAWKLHEAIAHGDTTVCAHCSRWDGQRVLGVIPYPCPTIRTLFPPAALDAPETTQTDSTDQQTAQHVDRHGRSWDHHPFVQTRRTCRTVCVCGKPPEHEIHAPETPGDAQ